MIWSVVFFFVVVASALAARMAYNQPIVWFCWLLVSGLAGIVFWQTGSQPQVAAFLVVAASGLGFVSPELWQSFRGWLARPRNFGWLVGLGMVAYVLYYPELMGPAGTLIIILFGVWVMIGRPGRHRA